MTDTTSGGLANPTPVNLVLDGDYLFFLRSPVPPSNLSLASDLPRYERGTNQNILAPVWMSNELISTPAGFHDEYYVYATPDPVDFPGPTTWTVTAGAVTGFPNPVPFESIIDPGYEFRCLRMLFDVEVTASAVATVVGKIRTGGGFVYNDNYIDLQRYLCGTEAPKEHLWVAGGDSVFVDAALVDVTGTGTVTFQAHFEGYRRRPQ